MPWHGSILYKKIHLFSLPWQHFKRSGCKNASGILICTPTLGTSIGAHIIPVGIHKFQYVFSSVL